MEVAVAVYREKRLTQKSISADENISEAEAASGRPERGEGRK